MYCAANTYFYLVRAHISLFVRVPFSLVCLYVNLRVPVYLYVNIRGFGPCTRIHYFSRVPFFPLCMSVKLRGFGPRLSVCVTLSSVYRGLPLSTNSPFYLMPIQRVKNLPYVLCTDNLTASQNLPFRTRFKNVQ